MATQERETIPVCKLFEAVLPYQSSVYVTALNIVQALALGFWLNEANNTFSKGEITIEWFLRSAAALGAILVVWHSYAIELQYLGPPAWMNTFGPFFLGASECALAFSTDPAVPLGFFIGFFIALKAIAIVAYGYAYRARYKPLTERLYREFYSEYPQFASYLTAFLKRHDIMRCLWYTCSTLASLAMLLLLLSLPEELNRVLFPAAYIAELVFGELTGRLEKSRSRDLLLAPYFQR